MQVESWLSFLIIGAIAGWLAGNFMKGGGFGIVGKDLLGASRGLVLPLSRGEGAVSIHYPERGGE